MKTYTMASADLKSNASSSPLNEHDLSSYDPKKWRDCGGYYLYDADQGEPDWLLVRIGRPSGSSSSYLIGHGNPNFGTPDDAALEIAGVRKKTFTPQQLEAMGHGTKMEPYSRDWYAGTNKVQVEELGFVTPKWDLEIGVSIDGDVIGTDGIIEIKCPKRMYRPLETYMAKQARGMVLNKDDFSHIWKSHYDQMQLGMAVLGKKWCDYVVYCTPENNVFTQRVPFNEFYWNGEMYPKIRDAIEKKIKPHLIGTPFPLMP